MMKLEDALRDNLKAAADALIVPVPKHAKTPSETPKKRTGLRFALAGAAAVLALAVPALLWQGGGAPENVGAPTTVAPLTESSAAPTPSSAPSTTIVPDTTTTAITTTTIPPDGSRQIIGETVVGDDRVVIEAERIDDEDPPTATVRLQLRGSDGSVLADEIVVGPVASFFWHAVTGQDALCEFSFEPADGGAELTVQLLQSPSLGCSDPYLFELRSSELSLIAAPPEDVARGFVAAWQADQEDAMSDLAEPVAVQEALEIGQPDVDPSLATCEGAAGNVYCTWDDGDRSVVVRVRTQLPIAVVEVLTDTAE